MKVERGVSRTAHKGRLTKEPVEDSYRAAAKLPEPTACPKCGATYHKGHWTWQKAPAGAHVHRCPACQRIEDDFPAGYVTLKGKFLLEHRAEILNLVKAREEREKSEHPLQRIMAIKDVAEGVQVTTTDTHLARGIAQAIHEAYKGELDLVYGRDESLLRATWKR